MTRTPQHGFTLLPTLAALLLLAGLVVLLQSRSQSNLRLLARLTAELEDQVAQDALQPGPERRDLGNPGHVSG